jgi:hypothetical protein
MAAAKRLISEGRIEAYVRINQVQKNNEGIFVLQ